MTDINDDLQAAGDDRCDRRTFEDRLNDLEELGYPNTDDYADYGYNLPYPPRPEDLA